MDEKRQLTLGRPRGWASLCTRGCRAGVLFILIATFILAGSSVDNLGLAQVESVTIGQGPEQPKAEAVAEIGKTIAGAEEAIAGAEEAVAEAEEARRLVSRTDVRISMDFKDAPIKDILKIFSQQAGLNFVASERIENRKVTLYLDDVRVDDALTNILRANGLIYEQEEDSDIFLVKDAGVPRVETITRIYKLSYATVTGVTGWLGGPSTIPTTLVTPSVSGEEAEERFGEKGIESVLWQLLTENGRLVADTRTNSLIISDIPSRFKMIEEVIAELDVRPYQVMICAEVLEVGLDTLNKLGVEWGSTGNMLGYTAPSKSSFFPFPFEDQIFGGRGGPASVTMGTLSLNAFQSTLYALLTETDTHYLARPRLLTLNNLTAQISISADTVIGTRTVVSGAGSEIVTSTEEAERAEIGTILKVTPQISKEGYVTITIEPEVSRAKSSSISGFFDKTKRTAKTTVMVKDGDTVVIAGLISREDSYAVQKVPILGDIPIIGAPFRRTTEDKEDTEVIIFITPHIIKDETGYLAELGAEYGLSAFPVVAPAPGEVAKKREQTPPMIIAREQELLSPNKDVALERRK